MDALLRSAPSTLNIADKTGRTALTRAAESDHRMAVSHLLSAGATERVVLAKMGKSALLFTIFNLKESMVRLLLDEGLEAVGGMPAMPQALKTAIAARSGTILQMVLDMYPPAIVNGRFWEKQALEFGGVPALHIAAAFGSLPVMHVLLATGADETVVTSDGTRASDIVQQRGSRSDEHEAEKAAMVRMLERGPAFRATSWAWITRANFTSLRAPGPPSVGVRVFRQGDRRVFVTRFPR